MFHFCFCTCVLYSFTFVSPHHSKKDHHCINENSNDDADGNVPIACVASSTEGKVNFEENATGGNKEQLDGQCPEDVTMLTIVFMVTELIQKRRRRIALMPTDEELGG